jgi:hypothetical protein
MLYHFLNSITKKALWHPNTPMVISASLKTISFVTLPPKAPTMRTKICCLEMKVGSSLGMNHVRPQAQPLGIRVTFCTRSCPRVSILHSTSTSQNRWINSKWKWMHESGFFQTSFKEWHYILLMLKFWKPTSISHNIAHNKSLKRWLPNIITKQKVTKLAWWMITHRWHV